MDIDRHRPEGRDLRGEGIEERIILPSSKYQQPSQRLQNETVAASAIVLASRDKAGKRGLTAHVRRRHSFRLFPILF